MLLNATRVDVWVAELDDEAGNLASKLQPLTNAGCNLEFVIARRTHSAPGKGVVYVTPIEGPQQQQAAEAAGFHKSQSVFTLKVEGPDEPGLGYRITRALAAKGINLRGLSASRLRDHALFFLALDSEQDATVAADAIKNV